MNKCYGYIYQDCRHIYIFVQPCVLLGHGAITSCTCTMYIYTQYQFSMKMMQIIVFSIDVEIDVKIISLEGLYTSMDMTQHFSGYLLSIRLIWSVNQTSPDCTECFIVFKCRLSFVTSMKPLWQRWHLYLYWPICSCIWRRMVNMLQNVRSHGSQRKDPLLVVLTWSYRNTGCVLA